MVFPHCAPFVDVSLHPGSSAVLGVLCSEFVAGLQIEAVEPNMVGLLLDVVLPRVHPTLNRNLLERCSPLPVFLLLVFFTKGSKERN